MTNEDGTPQDLVGSHEPASPCVKVCRISGNVCIGCLRTLDEIAGWPLMNDQEKATVLSRIQNLGLEKYF